MTESRISDGNYYQVQGWMINRLGLKGISLSVFAIIYGFSQDGESEYTGSLQYLCDFCGRVSKPTVINALKNLVELKYIIRREEYINNVQFNRYRANLPLLKNFNRGSEESSTGVVKLFESDSKESLHNNELNNKPNDIKLKKEKMPKHSHGEYHHVLLTDKEYENLASDYGAELRGKAISFLDEYIEEKGYKSKSHNLAIRRWVIEAVQEKERKGPKPQPKYSSYNADDALEKALERSYSSFKTAGNDEEVRKKAEALKAKLS